MILRKIRKHAGWATLAAAAIIAATPARSDPSAMVADPTPVDLADTGYFQIVQMSFPASGFWPNRNSKYSPSATSP